jgi:hypothetical protein
MLSTYPPTRRVRAGSPFLSSGVFARGGSDAGGPDVDSVVLSGKEAQDRQAIVSFFVSHLSSVRRKLRAFHAVLRALFLASGAIGWRVGPDEPLESGKGLVSSSRSNRLACRP